MAQKQKLGIIEEHSKKLESLREARQPLSGDLYKELDHAEEMFENLYQFKQDEIEGKLEKIDKGLNQYSSYKQTIADLAEVLTDNLTEYVQFAAEGQNYQGFEKVLAFFPFTAKIANRKRLQRLRTQSPRENLQQI